MTRGRQLDGRLRRRAVALWAAVYVGCAVWGAVIVWVVGHRGIFLYDQSGVFDGGWRMLQGQVMYRDFFAPYGPLVFWIQSLFFRLAGVNYSAMVLSAAVLNSVAVLCVIRIVRRLLPDPVYRVPAVAAGLLTALWFQAPSGTLWFEQTSFAFNLIALTLLLEAGARACGTATCLRVAAGCALAAALLSKQTAGAILLPVPIGVVAIAIPGWRQKALALLQVGGGGALVAAVFAAWLWAYSSPQGFWDAVVVMSRVLGAQRVENGPGTTDLLALTWTRPWIRESLAALAIWAVVSGARARRTHVLPLWVIAGCIVCQNTFASLTLNETVNSMGFLGLISGLTFGLIVQWLWRPGEAAPQTREHVGRLRLAGAWWRPPHRTALAVALSLVAAVVLFTRPASVGWRVAVHRYVQQFDDETSFTERLEVPRASRVLWGEPTVLQGARVARQDFEAVNAWLADAGVNFFAFESSSLLYGLQQRVSPQPWVYLTPDHSYLRTEIASVAAAIVASLKKHEVAAIVLETTDDAAGLLAQMPALGDWLQADFQRAHDFGFYEVWTRRPPD